MIVLDADERLYPEERAALRSVLGKPWRSAAQVDMIHATRRDGVGFDVSSTSLRMWRHLPSVRYEGVVHEQVRGLPRYLPVRFDHLPVRVLHDGYRDEIVAGKDKFERNRRLLERQVEESGGNARAFALYNLGVEHLVRGDAGDAQAILERAVGELDRLGGLAPVPWGPMLAQRLTSARRIHGDHARGERDAARWLALFPDHTDLAMERAHCAFALDPERGLELLDAAIGMGDGPTKYNSIVGSSTHVGAAVRGDLLAEAGRHRDAVASYRAGLRTNPGYVAAVGGLARSLLCDGTPPADVLAELRPFAWPYIEAAGALLGTAFLAADAADQAEAVFSELHARCPTPWRRASAWPPARSVAATPPPRALTARRSRTIPARRRRWRAAPCSAPCSTARPRPRRRCSPAAPGRASPRSSPSCSAPGATCSPIGRPPR